MNRREPQARTPLQQLQRLLIALCHPQANDLFEGHPASQMVTQSAGHLIYMLVARSYTAEVGNIAHVVTCALFWQVLYRRWSRVASLWRDGGDKIVYQ